MTLSTINFSARAYAEIESAAAAADMSMDAWVLAKLPLESAAHDSTEPAPALNGKPARTMADLSAGRVGVVASGGDGRLSENTGEKFTDILVEKRRQGRL